jgi:hypothetical protein
MSIGKGKAIAGIIGNPHNKKDSHLKSINQITLYPFFLKWSR